MSSPDGSPNWWQTAVDGLLWLVNLLIAMVIGVSVYWFKVDRERFDKRLSNVEREQSMMPFSYVPRTEVLGKFEEMTEQRNRIADAETLAAQNQHSETLQVLREMREEQRSARKELKDDINTLHLRIDEIRR